MRLLHPGTALAVALVTTAGIGVTPHVRLTGAAQASPGSLSTALDAHVAEGRLRTRMFNRHVLTPGPEQISWQWRKPGRLVFTGRNHTGAPIRDWNRREVFTRTRTRRSTNHEVCATWRSQSTWTMQQGLAVRVRESRHRLRAVTVTKNVFANFFWVFNLHTWDTRRSGDPWRLVGQFDMSDVVAPHGRLLSFPWRVCLRVRGRAVSFKVWLPRREPDPGWADAGHVRQSRLSARYVFAGLPGWYVGHFRARRTTVFSRLQP